MPETNESQLSQSADSIQETAAQTDSSQNKPLEVTDLDTFVHILTRWHHVKVTELVHLLSIPDEGHVGVVLLEDDKEVEHVMEGELLKGFKAGIKVALVALGRLPFGVTFDTPEAKIADNPEPTKVG